MKSSPQIIRLVIVWTARGISTLAAAFWLLILVDILACDALVGFVCLNWEIALLTGIVTASAASVVITWRWEGFGGFAMFLWGLAFTTIAYLTSRPQQLVSMLVSGVPFIIAGLLFLASQQMQGMKDKGNEPAG